MSEPAIRPINGSGEIRPNEWVGGNRPVAPAHGLYSRAAVFGEVKVPEPDRAELTSIGAEAYAVFTVQQKTGVVSIKIVDSRSGEVIRQIPAEELLQIAEQAQAYLEARRAHRG
jgi:hypothetical protein